MSSGTVLHQGWVWSFSVFNCMHESVLSICKILSAFTFYKFELKFRINFIAITAFPLFSFVDLCILHCC